MYFSLYKKVNPGFLGIKWGYKIPILVKKGEIIYSYGAREIMKLPAACCGVSSGIAA
jgi:hypothetical protein